MLRVRGDSMIDEQIRDGDLVVVESRSDARNGETVVALVRGGEATLKRFYRRGAKVVLEPANRAFRPLELPAARRRDPGRRARAAPAATLGFAPAESVPIPSASPARSSSPRRCGSGSPGLTEAENRRLLRPPGAPARAQLPPRGEPARRARTPRTGMLIDLKDVKDAAGARGDGALRPPRPERRHATCFEKKPPTAENLAALIFELLDGAFARRPPRPRAALRGPGPLGGRGARGRARDLADPPLPLPGRSRAPARRLLSEAENCAGLRQVREPERPRPRLRARDHRSAAASTRRSGPDSRPRDRSTPSSAEHPPRRASRTAC